MIRVGDYTVIADTGRTIVQLLQEKLTPEPILQPEYVGLCSPADHGDFNLTLFLYKIKESSEIRYTQMIDRGMELQQFPSMALDLYYLMTAHSNAELHSRAIDESRILGRAIQVLYDHSIIRGSLLQGTLAENDEEVRIVMDELELDVMVSLFPDQPYKCSVSFAVGPVTLQSQRMKQTKRVTDKDFRIMG